MCAMKKMLVLMFVICTALFQINEAHANTNINSTVMYQGKTTTIVPMSHTGQGILEKIKHSCLYQSEIKDFSFPSPQVLRASLKEVEPDNNFTMLVADINGKAFYGDIEQQRVRRVTNEQILAEASVICYSAKSQSNVASSNESLEPSGNHNQSPGDSTFLELQAEEVSDLTEFFSQIAPPNVITFKNLFLGMKVPVNTQNQIEPKFLAWLGLSNLQGVQIYKLQGDTQIKMRKILKINANTRSKCDEQGVLNQCWKLFSGLLASNFIDVAMVSDDPNDIKLTLWLNANRELVYFKYTKSYKKSTGTTKQILAELLSEQIKQITSISDINWYRKKATVLQTNPTIDPQRNLPHLIVHEYKLLKDVYYGNMNSKDMFQGAVVTEDSYATEYSVIGFHTEKIKELTDNLNDYQNATLLTEAIEAKKQAKSGIIL